MFAHQDNTGTHLVSFSFKVYLNNIYYFIVFYFTGFHNFFKDPKDSKSDPNIVETPVTKKIVKVSSKTNPIVFLNKDQNTFDLFSDKKTLKTPSRSGQNSSVSRKNKGLKDQYLANK